MKTLSLTLLMFVLTSFNISTPKEELLLKDEYGKLSVNKDFIVVDYSCCSRFLFNIS